MRLPADNFYFDWRELGSLRFINFTSGDVIVCVIEVELSVDELE